MYLYMCIITAMNIMTIIISTVIAVVIFMMLNVASEPAFAVYKIKCVECCYNVFIFSYISVFCFLSIRKKYNGTQ